MERRVLSGASVFRRKIICNEGTAQKFKPLSLLSQTAPLAHQGAPFISARSEAFLRGIPDATHFSCRVAANFSILADIGAGGGTARALSVISRRATSLIPFSIRRKMFAFVTMYEMFCFFRTVYVRS